jgi:methanethiol oxidase
MDCETFDVIGRYELDRGLQDKHYDFWWNLPRDYMVSSEWGCRLSSRTALCLAT